MNACRHPAIQRLKPMPGGENLVWTAENRLTLAGEIDTIAASRDELIWLPTLDQLLCLLKEKSKARDEPIIRPHSEGWECLVTIDEWAEDYGASIETQRRFAGSNLHEVALDALKAALGVGERWMV